MVVVFALPETTGPSQDTVSFLGRIRFPRVKDLSQSPLADRLEHHMNVVRHHAPGEKPIPVPVEVMQRFSDYLCDRRFAEETCPRSGIQVRLNLLTKQLCKPTLFGEREIAAHCFRGFHNVSSFELKCVRNCLRQGIGETKGDKVGPFRAFPVRESSPASNGHHERDSNAKRPAGRRRYRRSPGVSLTFFQVQSILEEYE